MDVAQKYEIKGGVFYSRYPLRAVVISQIIFLFVDHEAKLMAFLRNDAQRFTLIDGEPREVVEAAFVDVSKAMESTVYPVLTFSAD